MNALARTLILVTLGLYAGASPAAEEFTVSQKDKKFSVQKLSVKVGDKVTFRNDDTFSHNIFSLSDPNSFDLGTYGKGASKTVTFSKPGKVEIECAIHPDMKMVIEVAP